MPLPEGPGPIIRLVNGTGERQDACLTDDRRHLMFGGARLRRDPFEGRGAYRRRLRIRIEGLIALGLVIVAHGLTAAAWIRLLEPGINRILFG
jgi:hypothetical protein